MNNIVGQERVISYIDNLETFPNVVLLNGPFGSGKHLIANYISEKLNLEMVDITANISSSYINVLYNVPNPYIYLINLNDINEINQNVILKFIETPPTNIYLILLTDNKATILPTLINRVICINLDPYKKEDLIRFVDMSNVNFTEDKGNLLLNICETPGQIKAINYNTLSDMKRICNSIISSIDKATFPNTLTIADKFNYDDEYDKFNIIIFFNMLQYLLLEEFKSNDPAKNKDLIYKYCLVAAEYSKDLTNSKLNKRNLIENFLTALWSMSRC